MQPAAHTSHNCFFAAECAPGQRTTNTWSTKVDSFGEKATTPDEADAWRSHSSSGNETAGRLELAPLQCSPLACHCIPSRNHQHPRVLAWKPHKSTPGRRKFPPECLDPGSGKRPILVERIQVRLSESSKSRQA